MVQELSLPESPKTPRLRIEFLDGIRGLAALYVMLHHIGLFMQLRAADPKLFRYFESVYNHIFAFGHQAVVIFIVLSGYVLMLPVSRTSHGCMPKSYLDYFKRRARRILPPYYAALLLVLLLFAIFPFLGTAPPGSEWNIPLPPFSISGIASHLFLIHNLTPYGYKIDPPMWSIGAEWQIYFLFPFVLLPLWRHYSFIAPLLASFIFSLAVVHSSLQQYTYTAPWLIFAFSCGMSAAIIGFWHNPRYEILRNKTPWYLISALAFLGSVWAHHFLIRLVHWGPAPLVAFLKDSDSHFVVNSLVAITAASFIVGSVQELQRQRSKNFILRLMDAPATVKLGTFSYSLYLVHYPLIGFFFCLLLHFHLSETYIGLCLLLLAPVIVGIAYLFHQVFERPFMPTHLRKGMALSLEKLASPLPQQSEAE